MQSRLSLPKLKYCGFTRKQDIQIAIDAGADAIGLNFYPASPRYVSPETARTLSRIIGKQATVVGVFVNANPGDVAAIAQRVGLDYVQLHGDEEPDWAERASQFVSLQGMPLIKAVSWRDSVQDRQVVQEWAMYARSCEDHSRSMQLPLVGFLVDSFDPVQRGGTGKTARWDLLWPRPSEFTNIPVMLAGGLKAENVLEAVEIAKPDGIDLASGIEESPGIKSSEKMEAIATLLSQWR
jgi:phosphoribosylanthranilate isomerase